MSTDDHPHGDRPEHGPVGTDDHGHDHGPAGSDDHGHDHAPGGPLARAWAGLVHAVRPHSHDHADSVDDALVTSAAGIRATKISLLLLAVTAVLQVVVFLVSGSVALLADTIHNVSDAFTSIPLWIAFVLLRRPPSRRFTYGLGRVEDLAGIVIVLFILASAVVVGFESVRAFADPRGYDNVLLVALAGVIGFVGNEAVAVYRIRVGRRIGSAALVADGNHARTDGFTSLGVVASAVGVSLGFPLADPLVGLAITVAILVILVGAARDVLRRLLDAVDPAMVDHAEQVLAAVPGVEHVEGVRMRWTGHRVRAEADVTVDPDLDVRAAHDISEAARHELLHAVKGLDDVTVHVGPTLGEEHGDPHGLTSHHRRDAPGGSPRRGHEH
ncbi:cation diffusion facilitator family transporter [Aquipuribacter hungaricus]|uniref:Cation diffusion facilitator family transporter n=1 Tax=Aquipuribacter hungaricus TaxID=545624 RepID=A0ABV7WE73_9MICO